MSLGGKHCYFFFSLFLVQEVLSIIITLCFSVWIYPVPRVSTEVSLMLEVIELEFLETLWPTTYLKCVSGLEFNLVT